MIANRLQPERIDAAILLIEETLRLKGYEAARDLYRQLQGAPDPAKFAAAWSRLCAEMFRLATGNLMPEGQAERVKVSLETLEVLPSAGPETGDYLTQPFRTFEEAQALYALMQADASGLGDDIDRDRIAIHFHGLEVRQLMRAGRIDEAELRCKDATRRYRSRALHRLGRTIAHHRKWLAYREMRERTLGLGRPIVSIMLITYNHEKYIGKAIESVLMQETEYQFEIVVIEDCSTDRTQEVILRYKEKYPDKIRTYFNPTNIGTLDPPQQKVTYAGFKRLLGDYVCILEGDDYWLSPHKLQRQIRFLEKNPTFAACAHNTIKVYEEGKLPSHRFIYSENPKHIHTIDDFITMMSFFHTTGVMYRNVLFSDPAPYYRSKWSCDIFNVMSHVQHGDLFYMDDDMAVYRAHAGGSYSNMLPIKGRIFNIDGLRHYNRWLGLRYLKGFAYTLNRLTRSMLDEEAAGQLTPLAAGERERFEGIWKFYGRVYDFLVRHPG